MIAHLKPISTSWKFERATVSAFDPDRHEVNRETLAALARVFPERFPADRVTRLMAYVDSRSRDERTAETVAHASLLIDETWQRPDHPIVVTPGTGRITAIAGGVEFKLLVHADRINLTVRAELKRNDLEVGEVLERAGMTHQPAKGRGFRVAKWAIEQATDIDEAVRQAGDLMGQVVAAWTSRNPQRAS